MPAMCPDSDQNEALRHRSHSGNPCEAGRPGCNVVGFAGNGAKGHLNVVHGKPFAEYFQSAIGEPVLLAKPAKVFDGHSSRKIGAVAIPVQQVKCRRRFSQHVTADRWAIDQVVGPEERESSRHEKALEAYTFRSHSDSIAPTKSSVRNGVNSPWSEKSVRVVKNVADLTELSFFAFR